MGKIQTAFIDQWGMQIGGTVLPYAAPETNRYVLTGDIKDHPILGDMRYAVTSHVVNLDVEAGVCETRNTIYTLGAPAEDYLQHCRDIDSPSIEALEALVRQET